MIYRIGHIILALLLFISSSGFVLQKHYCQNELKSMALFVKAKPCHSQKAMKSCPMHSAAHQKDRPDSKGCCDDKAQYLKAETDQLAQVQEIDIHCPPVLWATLGVAPQIDLPTIDAQTLHYLNYKPPPLVCDLPISLQTFLC